MRNATNLVFTLESGISFMFNSTVQQVKSTKKVQNGKMKALDPGSSAFAFIRHFFDIQVLRVEGLEHTIVDCWKCLKYATFSRWNCSTDKRKNQAVPTIYPQ